MASAAKIAPVPVSSQTLHCMNRDRHIPQARHPHTGSTSKGPAQLPTKSNLSPLHTSNTAIVAEEKAAHIQKRHLWRPRQRRPCHHRQASPRPRKKRSAAYQNCPHSSFSRPHSITTTATRSPLQRTPSKHIINHHHRPAAARASRSGSHGGPSTLP